MMRISTIFVAVCMVLVSGSLGVALYSLTSLRASEAAVVALAALTLLILYNAVAMRMRDRSDVDGQISDLSHGIADLARQVGEFGRRLAAVESKMVSPNPAPHDRIQLGLQSALGEISELGGLVKQLAASVATHEDILASLPTAPPPAAEPAPPTRVAAPAPARPAPASAAPPAKHEQILTAVQSAIETDNVEIFLQPVVTLPQRKTRCYEAVARLRDTRGALLAAGDFMPAAEAAGLMGRIDNMVVVRCMEVLRRLQMRNKDASLFCNVAAATLGNRTAFGQYLDFLEANRTLASSLILEFRHGTLRGLGLTESEHLAALAQRGYRFSIDHVTDLRIEPRELADRGVRFIKVPASLLLDQNQASASDIHPADLSDLLGRFGIDLIVERIEDERAVVDLLDYDIRFGQGFLFAHPLPLRPDAPASTADKPKTGGIKPEHPPRMTGVAALARRASGVF
jgi:cyclic-di-GMP phosphodiesterase TipF (flagellum assembly factor)